MFESSLIAWISKGVIQKIYSEVQIKYPFETGGCLLGYWDDSLKEVVIEECIGPGPKAKHSRFYFKPDSQWQEKEIAHIYLESGRLRTYLGDWHAHPNGNLELSWRDRRTLLRIANYKPARIPYPLMMLIAGPPWHLKVWKFERARGLFLLVETSECNVKEYAT